MKLTKLSMKQVKIDRLLAREDKRYLQKRISGRSVYKSLDVPYFRKPKHRSIGYQY